MKDVTAISNKGMSVEMYDYIVDNINRLKYELDNGVVITPKGTNALYVAPQGI